MIGRMDQREHWESIYTNSPERFGHSPSRIGKMALRLFLEEGVKTMLELGCDQGRDTLCFLDQGMEVIGLDYSPTCLEQLRRSATSQELDHLVHLQECDLRDGIPLPDGSVDAVFSHMFFTMHLREGELDFLFREVLRVLRPGGINLYSVRTVEDPHFGAGSHVEEDMWENNGFVVHFFSREKVERLSQGYKILSLDEFEEGGLPKHLYQVVLRKPGDR
jgi:SAM-dependent methyltransferase